MSNESQDSQLNLDNKCLMHYSDGEIKIITQDKICQRKITLFDTILENVTFLLSGIVTLFCWTAIITQTTVRIFKIKVF